MDLLDSPLNLAHQQSRKADRYLKSGRFDDAIECHRKAAEYLTKAMAATTIQQALESFSLQRESHIRQQAVIRERQRRQLTSSERSSSHTTRSLSETTSDPDLSSNGGNRLSYLKSLHDTDLVLKQMNNRRTASASSSEEFKEESQPERDDKSIMDELRSQNDALRAHFLALMKQEEEQRRQVSYLQGELEFSRRETRELKDRLSKQNKQNVMQESLQSDNFYSMPLGMNMDNLPSLELPPLEMPKFDFDSLKSAEDEEDSH